MWTLEGHGSVRDFVKGAHEHLKTEFDGRTGWLRAPLHVLL